MGVDETLKETTVNADTLNAFLAAGKTVYVSTYGHHIKYTKRHAGMFFTRNGDLYVKSGNTSNCLTHSNGRFLMVRIEVWS